MLFDKDKIFFTSDLHFNHNNIISFCGRPYGDVKDMEKAIIDNWNSVVPEDGVVFILGDIGFITIAQLESIINKLNGIKYFVLGNHDKRLYNKNIKQFNDLFEGVRDIMNININDGRELWLSHYPLMCYPGNNKNSVLQLHGHIHSGPGLYTDDIVKYKNCKTKYQYDVGVDNNNYTPVSYNEILNKLGIQQ